MRKGQGCFRTCLGAGRLDDPLEGSQHELDVDLAGQPLKNLADDLVQFLCNALWTVGTWCCSIPTVTTLLR